MNHLKGIFFGDESPQVFFLGAGIDHLKVFFLGGDESPQGFFRGQGLITSRFFLVGMNHLKVFLGGRD